MPAIEQSDLRARLSIFADDSMLGRTTKDEGHARAVRDLAAEAGRIGLTPAGENGTFFQTFFLRVRKLNAASTIVVDDAPQGKANPVVQTKKESLSRRGRLGALLLVRDYGTSAICGRIQ